MLSLNKFKVLFLCYLFAAGVILPSACTSETEVEVMGVGYIVPVVAVDGSYVDAATLTEEMLDVERYGLPTMFLRSVTEGYERIWDKWTDYNPETGLNAGTYLINCSIGTPFSEGFLQPWFCGEKEIVVSGGVSQECNLVCRLSNSMVKVDYSEAFLSRFKGGRLILHSEGGGFIEYNSGEQSPVYIKSGGVVVILCFENEGEEIRLYADEMPGLKPGYRYSVDVDYSSESDVVLIEYKDVNGNRSTEIAVNDAVLSESAVSLSCGGFESGSPIEVAEGCEPNHSVIVKAAKEELKQLLLSISSASSVFDGLTGDVDLLKSSKELDKLKALGLKVNEINGEIEVDFAEIISSVILNQEFSTSEFSVYAISKQGFVSEPVIVKLVTTVPTVYSVSAAKTIEGTNRAFFEINTNANLKRYGLVEIKSAEGKWQQASNVVVDSRGENAYSVTFEVADVDKDYEVRLMYLGCELCLLGVEQTSPRFTISVDAFALKAYIKVECEEKTIRDYVLENLSVFGNGELLSISSRDFERGIAVVTGLSENTKYKFIASIFQNPTSANYVTPSVAATTETCAQLPNSDFEDLEKGINYKNLPSGGRFSQTIVPIYNRQNYVSYDLSVPKRWANCNAKTFCRESTVANSWYMQPSAFTVSDAFSGNYAVKIQSVGWDNRGENIADYLQEGQPYLDYSRVVPNISYRAAGKLFLGSYEFVPSTNGETYNNGISFPSRPIALNGYYKYSSSRADVSDRGLVKVELTGLVNEAEVVVASGTSYLSPAGSYRAFTVELSYRLFNVKAYSLKIMFASSEATGDIDFETANIKTYSNEQTATSIGSELWIDELKLSY